MIYQLNTRLQKITAVIVCNSIENIKDFGDEIYVVKD